jgi:hypothetical protein
MPSMPTKISKLMYEQYGSWITFLSISFTIFIVFVSITSWIHSVVEWPLLPHFENSIEQFRVFTHAVFDNFFYLWISVFLAYVSYAAMLILEPIFSWIPYIPTIAIPSWVSDAAIISIILLRSQKRAMRDSNPLTTLAMSKSEREEWSLTIKTAPPLSQTFISFAWKVVLLIYFTAKVFRYPFEYFRLPRLSNFVGIFVGGCLLLGLAYFVHDVALAYATRDSDLRYAQAHRSFMKITVLILGVALATSLCFFVMNGYMVAS